jgi:hypothetical protein
VCCCVHWWSQSNDRKNGRGVVAHIKESAPSCSNSHCVFHRHALVSKTMERDLKTLLDDAVKIVNYINQDHFIPVCLNCFAKKWAANKQRCCFIQKEDGCLGENFLLEFLNFARRFIIFYWLPILSFSLFGKYILAAEIGILSKHFYKN